MYTVSSTRSILKGALAVLAVLVVLTGCGDDAVVDDGEEPAPTEATVFIANQGNFGDANGSVSTFDPQTEESDPEAIGVDVLGSTVQGMRAADDRLYVVSNTAGRIDAFAGDNLTRVGQTDTELSNPRYLEVLDDDKVYLTNQAFEGASTVEVFDFSGDAPALETSIEVSGSPETITRADDRVYVALGAFDASTNLAMVDTATDELIEEVDIECAARFVHTDQDNEVFAFCNAEEEQGQVVILDGATGDELNRIDLPGSVRSAEGVTQAAAHAPGANEMYVVVDEQEVVRLDTITNEIDGEIGPVDGAPIGALGFDAETEQLFLGRVPGFDVSGTVTIHDRAGTQMDEFTAGVAPTHIDIQREQ